jgi:hypothetical protein
LAQSFDTSVRPTDTKAAAQASNRLGEIHDGEDESESLTGFWSAGKVRPPYFVRPCRKRFDLYQLSATPPERGWHKENAMAQQQSQPQPDAAPDALPEPGRKKKSPRELDKLLDQGIEDSMAASDPPAAAQPEVHTEPDREATNVETEEEKKKH